MALFLLFFPQICKHSSSHSFVPIILEQLLFQRHGVTICSHVCNFSILYGDR